MKNLNKIRESTLGEILIDEDLITLDQLQSTLDEQKVNGDLLINIVLRNDYLKELDLARALVKTYQLPFLYPADYRLNPKVKEILPITFLHTHMLYPLDLFGQTLTLVTSGTLDVDLIEDLERTTEKEVNFFIALHSSVQYLLREVFPLDEVTSEVNSRMDELFGGNS